MPNPKHPMAHPIAKQGNQTQPTKLSWRPTKQNLLVGEGRTEGNILMSGGLRITYGTDQLACRFLQFNPSSIQLDDECPQFFHTPLIE